MDFNDIGAGGNYEEKKRNIKKMYDEICRAYKHAGRHEVALVFIAKGDEHQIPYYYDTRRNKYKKVVASEEDILSNPFHVVNVSESVRALQMEAVKEGYTNNRTTVMHNHFSASLFNFIDIKTFFEEKTMREVYIDTSDYIYFFQKIDDMEQKYTKENVSIMIDIAMRRKEELKNRLNALFIENGEEEDEKVANANLITASEGILNQFADEIWQEICDEFGINALVNRIRIKKRELRHRLYN